MNNVFKAQGKSDKERGTIGNVMFLLKPYKIRIILSLICSVIITIITVHIPIVTKWLMDEGIMSLNIKNIIKYSFMSLVLIIANQSASFLQTIIHVNLKNKMNLNLERNALRKLLRLRMENFNEKGFHAIFNSVTFNVENICQIADKSFLMVAMAVFKMVGGLIGLLFISYKLTLIILIVIPIKFFLINILSNERVKMFNKLLSFFEDIGMWYGDVINGITEIKLWNIYEKKEDEFCLLQEGKLNLNKKVEVLSELKEYSESIIEGIISSLTYIFGAILAINGEMTVGGIIAFIMYISMVNQPISLIIAIKYNFANVKPSLDNYLNFMNKEEEYNDNLSVKNTTIKELKTITLEKIKLEYDGKVVLNDINIEFKKGEKVALIGTNGSGKTSFINLLLRFYRPTQGEVKINGQNIEEIDIEEYRNLFAVMSQNVYLFNASIRKNINYLNELSDKDIRNLCMSKNVEPFIEFTLKLENGLDSSVGMNGSKLSGGEKQKIGFLRTLLKMNSKIIILDEATSNYDMESEYLFNEVIEKCTSYSFLFVITHRPEVLKSMDRIVVLNEGNLIATGTYDELLENNEVPLESIHNQSKREEVINE